MRIKAKKNPATCKELSDYIGYPVNEWTQYPDGSMEVDIEVASLTAGERKALIKKLEQSQIHLVEGEIEIG